MASPWPGGSGCGSQPRTVKHLELITHHNSISISPGRNWNKKSMKKSTTPQVDHIPQAPGSPVRTKLYNKTEIELFSKELNNPDIIWKNSISDRFHSFVTLSIFLCGCISSVYRLDPFFKSFFLLQ